MMLDCWCCKRLHAAAAYLPLTHHIPGDGSSKRQILQTQDTPPLLKSLVPLKDLLVLPCRCLRCWGSGADGPYTLSNCEKAEREGQPIDIQWQELGAWFGIVLAVDIQPGQAM